MAPGEFTVGAVLWAGMAFYSISQGFADDRAPLVILGATGVAAMIVGVVWPIVVLRRVRVVVHGPTDATTGSLIRFTVALVGRGSNLAVRWLDPVGEWIHGDAPSVGEVPVIASRRGVVQRVRVEVKCTGPMNIFVRYRHASMMLETPLYIAPAVLPYEVLDDVATHHDVARIVHSSLATESVRSTRPYVVGDSPRVVHWASTARTGEIVVREFDPPAQAGVAIVVDLRGGTDVDIEVAASRASGAARGLLGRGLACMLVTCGTEPTEIRDTRTIDRVLARAIVGVPEPVPPGWNSVVIRP